ncbi:beta-N-acetylhexosaminidase [Paenibacillus sp. FSL H7-0357]|uniref:beta-N-acetylhexosaminidase n=1 Tax=Paenibacillus sp. FSL H7-0357 TaxID=1536774 RepID=UPI000690B79A|nr:beta-N-acetylhexosaminidase [Paenibacillus sp. FSL H7-0357]
MDWREAAVQESGLDMVVAEMSLSDKIGQMLMCGFEGTAVPDDGIRELVAKGGIGGVIYFARNVETPEQVARMTAELQRAAAEGGKAPLWISIDQEGGMVARITEGVALMPGGMAIAAAGSVEDAYRAALISGRELSAMGINLNYAPVLDVNNNARNPVIGVRSFGESPEKVADYGAATIRGFQDAGVAATAKHFPGHGDTDVDSHLDLPTVRHDRARMDSVELVPFRRAIAEGVDAMMSAHIYFPALEQEKLPVTLSKAVLTGLLREELGFGGIIMTDCMEMNAIAEHYGTVEASVLAIEAGADIVLISHRADRQLAAIEAILHAVAEGRISETRIDDSVRRLLALKVKRGVIAAGSVGGAGAADSSAAGSTAVSAGGVGAVGAGGAGAVSAEGTSAEGAGGTSAGSADGAGAVSAGGASAVSAEGTSAGGSKLLEMEDEHAANPAAVDVEYGHAASSAAAYAGLGLLEAPPHVEVARRISEASITLVRNQSSVLPLQRKKTLAVTAAPVVATLVDEAFGETAGLGTMLSKYGLDCIDRVVPAGDIASYAADLLEVARVEDIEQIVVGTYNAQFNPDQCNLVESLRALGKPLAVVALRNPYDLLAMPEIETYAAAYEGRPLALESAAKALLGQIPFQGRLPVSLGDKYPAGWGLSL